jgi:hypothetical protein
MLGYTQWVGTERRSKSFRPVGPLVTRPEIVVCVDVESGAELIDAAEAVLRPHRVGDRLFGPAA